MFKHYFTYWVTFLLLLNFAPLVHVIDVEIQQTIAVGFALLLGIPHGAVDHILYVEQSKVSTKRFIAFYLLAVGLNVAFWFIFPTLTFLSFLLLSAYHFGQSQFSGELKKLHPLNALLYVSWGTSVLAGLIFFNIDELLRISFKVRDLAFFRPILHFLEKPYLLIGTSIITVIQLIVYRILKLLSSEKLLMEAMILISIFVIAQVFSFLIGFSLFFVGVHSLKMILYEWEHFKMVSRQMTIKKFFLQLMPLTIVSFIGISFLLGMIYFDLLTISVPLTLLVVISSITLPHSFVMEYFFESKRTITN